MGFNTRAALAAATALAAFAAAPAAAQTGQPAPLLFDDFLFDNAGQPGENLNNFFQWEVTGGSVDLVGGAVPGAPGAPPNNPAGRFVDLGGSTGNPGLFRTRLAIPVAGLAPYTLTFDYRSTDGGLNGATVSVGGESFTVSTTSLDFTRFSRTLVFGTEVTAVFVAFQGFEADTDGAGLGIDVVQFGPSLPAVGAVPEPATWATMLLGFGAVGAALRRRRSARAAAA